MKRWIAIGVIGLASIGWQQPAWAVRTRFHDAAESMQYGEKMGGMIARGLLNGVTFWVDPLVGTVNGTQTGPPVIGTLTGLGRGIGCGVFRLGSGVVDLVTFWVPGFNGFPVSDSYQDCLATTTPPPMETGESWGASEPAAPEPAPSIPAAAPEPTKHTWTK